MMNRALAVAACLTMLVGAGCSSVTVNHDWDRQEDFSKLETFAWMEQPVDPAGDARAAAMSSGLFAARLHNSVNKHLQAKGYSIDTEKPDFVIVYHTGIQDKVNVTNWGYTYGPYWGPWGESVDVYQYAEGTLVLDFIDFETKQLIWRGTAQKALAENPDPEKVERNIDEVVVRLLERFPPQ
jgi:hypothetical protein